MAVVSGGELSPATVTSKSSVESNFRQLDDAFLQTQTRIWLGEVLQVRLDEEVDISDILADGNLLSELSEVLSTMLPSLREDATQSKSNEWKTFVSSMSTQRYMPYYNVGSFLKMCKNLGLDSIDLFTPSDVVEKRNTRKVCMCMRSLSKKARSRDLNVPDFDSVTCTLTMPTNMVECIRKSLEMSQSNSSLSDAVEVDNVLSVRSKNRISYSASTVSNECSSDICEDAESTFMVGEFNGPSDHNYDTESPSTQCSEVVVDYSSTRKLNTRDLENEEDDQCECLSPSRGESVGSPCSQYFSDQEVAMPASDCLGSHVSGKVDFSDAKPKYQTGDFLHLPIDWEDDHLGFGNHSEESNCVSQDEQDTDICDARLENLTHPSEIASEKSSCTNSIALGDGDVACEVLMEDSYGLNVVETSSDSLNNTNRDSVDLFGETSILQEQSSSLPAIKSNGTDNPLIFPGFDQCGTSDKSLHGSHTFVSTKTSSFMAGDDKAAFETKKTSLDHVEKFPNHNLTDLAVSRSCPAQSNSLVNMEAARGGKKCSENSRETFVIPQGHIPRDDGVVQNSYSNTLDDPQPGVKTSLSMEDADHKCLPYVEDIEVKTGHLKKLDGANDMPQHKPQKKLLKSVVKGTALLGVAVFLLHLRKNRQENLSRVRKQSVEPLKPSAPVPSPTKSQKGGKTSSVYPAEKLKFGF